MELTIINEQEVLGKYFTVYGTADEPLFVAKDVAEWIEYDLSSVNKMLDKIDEDEKLVGTLFRSGQNREVWFLTENGLYEVLMQSRKPLAKEFKKKVKEILKSIRKHGLYATDQLLNNPDFAIAAFQALKEERARKQALEAQIEADRPKVLFAGAVSASKSSCLIGELAKILKQNGIDIGQNKLFQWLRSNGYLISRRGESWNQPTQKSMQLGLFELKKTNINHADGHTTVNTTTKVTGKGQQYFINKFLNQEHLTG
ncbi:Antirepressor [Streptococcus pneumoniae]|uniref:Antirepressor n=1 Tax=Streptococcus pneumoniae TaxID=1313 RepID=A0A4P0A6Z0_STREE|nr:phage antirepressor KilAC domain-containing protein [Streptococcus pneumoniae]MDS2441319.1 phage antirepressor KilAC domain-containing protein [Streptococcus pneumoniae]MDS3058866.1 phage antirepressor KilAC domain-containing protein [Streptococcus pneumoniae]MDS3280425.1 phage antirepressor KilAC domain-containing protein [Streptococcus pneumoniae]MDS3301209.1 phage antirepressor KilAC domain-containing protein [Streptococcus pneumoniae]MDS3377785.1 phage antirepressor KilAC domain-contain